MKRLVLTLEETRILKKYGSVEIVRNGLDMVVEPAEYEECGYTVFVINPYNKVVLAKEPKEKQKKTKSILAAPFDPKKMHVYDVKTTGKHPVHMIEGGNYLTENEDDFGSGDMGWFYLNQKEYDYFKSQLKEIELDID